MQGPLRGRHCALPILRARAHKLEGFGEAYQAEPLFKDYGGIGSFSGQITTIRVFEDNVLAREALEEEGGGRVLVVDGGGSSRRALLGDEFPGWLTNTAGPGSSSPGESATARSSPWCRSV